MSRSTATSPFNGKNGVETAQHYVEPFLAPRARRPGQRADLRPRPPRAGRRRGQQRAQEGGADDGMLEGLPCQWSKMVNSDACPRPTTGDLDGRRRLVHGAGQAVPYGPGPLGAVKRPQRFPQ